MEYRVDNKYYKLGVLCSKIPNTTIYTTYSELYRRFSGRTDYSATIEEIFKNLEREYENKPLFLEELLKLKQEFVNSGEILLSIQIGENRSNRKHISQADDEMFTRGILSKE